MTSAQLEDRGWRTDPRTAADAGSRVALRADAAREKVTCHK